MKPAFDPDNESWAKEHAELKALLTDEEYARARSTILDAHYTSEAVVHGMYNVLTKFGFRHGRLLEPAMGTGNFIGLGPNALRARSAFTGVEYDDLTGRIAKQLYQTAEITAPRGFEDVNLPDDYYDVVIGNPPFGSQNVYDPRHPDLSKFSIHNFFFAKSVEKLRPGGILAMVTSRYFMDAVDPAARAWLAERTRLVGAVRLPDTAFKQNAGTEVVTDIVFLQKLTEGVEANPDEWVKTTTFDMEGQQADVNVYFAGNPQMVLGRFAMSAKMYAKGGLNVEAIEGETIDAGLWRVMGLLPADIYKAAVREVETLVDVDGLVPPNLKDGNFFVLPDGRIARKLPMYGDQMRYEVRPIESETAVKRVKGLVDVRNSLRALMRAELSPTPTPRSSPRSAAR